MKFAAITAALLLSSAAPALAAAGPALKKAALAGVEARAKLTQDMVDSVFSFAEPGFQEYRTADYLTGILEKNGFTITRGVAGIPTAWTASWGEAGPLIAMGSDVDALPGLSQVPGSPQIKPLVEGAPGHGEGHNSGLPMMITAALAAKEVMERNGLKGRLMIWPGIAEELLATKAFLVRAGVFKDVDASLYAHVSKDFSMSWGPAGNNGAVSVEYTFKGITSHAAVAPWFGRSALDGVEVMNMAWNMRREHLPLSQRSHYVITNGGDQPNIVPGEAKVWYYFRESTFDTVRAIYEMGNRTAEAAAMATDTRVSRRILGVAPPHHNNRPLAEAMYANMLTVGMPKWTAADQAFTRAVQQANKVKLEPLADKVAPLSTPATRGAPMGGASDDVGEVMWAVPTATIRYPANIPNVVGHNVQSAIAMATPIAHKGVMVAAKAVAMTVLDLVTTPRIISDAKTYFSTVQQQEQTYWSPLTDEDKPAIHLNAESMARVRSQMEPFYYDPARYSSYLEQLGIAWPPAD